jgi:hypothetical protein
MADQCLEVLRESAKRIIAALEKSSVSSHVQSAGELGELFPE